MQPRTAKILEKELSMTIFPKTAETGGFFKFKIKASQLNRQSDAVFRAYLFACVSAQRRGPILL